MGALTLYKQPISGQLASVRRPIVRRDGIPGIEQERLGMIDRADKLFENIRLRTPKNPLDLATPTEELVALPFPSLLPILPHDRFGLDRDNYWRYMAREKFKELLQGVDEPLEGPDAGLWFYGTTGYGKSHLLAALVCYLLSTGSQVIYIPDCQACLGDPVEYVRAAMLLAWAGNSALQMRIMGIKTRLDILQFFDDRTAEGCWVMFVIDQMNALEPTGKGAESADDAKNKASLEAWLYECSSQHMTIVGLSANNISLLRLQQSQRNYRRVNAYGGLTEAEMRCWWQRNGRVRYTDYTRHEIEDITGSVPLLLDGCVVNGNIDLSALPLVTVSEQVLQFMGEQYRENPGVWSRHWRYMSACVTHGIVPSDVPLSAVDQRYSFEKTVLGVKIGSYTCGVAREAVVKGLRLYGGTPGDHQSLLGPLRILTPYNSSVVGFYVKQAVLSLIANRGLRVGDRIISSLSTVLYSGHLPKAEGIGFHPILYCPLKFDFCGIDGIIINTEGSYPTRYRLLPLQVAIAGARAASEMAFFSQWSHWIDARGPAKIAVAEVEYVWIVGSGSPSVEVLNKSTSTRQGLGFAVPAYTRRTISLRDLCPEVYSELGYAQARRTG